MRATRAKQLRKMAQENTVGKPTVTYGYLESVRHIPTKKRTTGKSYQVVLAADCTRFEYQKLKRNFKQSRSKGI